MANTSLRSWLLSGLVAGSAFLSGCAGLCVGGVYYDAGSAGSQAGIPLLYAVGAAAGGDPAWDRHRHRRSLPGGPAAAAKRSPEPTETDPASIFREPPRTMTFIPEELGTTFEPLVAMDARR